MSFSEFFKKRIQENVPPVGKRHHYTITLYTGGVDVAQWKQLSMAEKEAAIKKHWFIKWWFRNPETGKMERQNNIKSGVNRLKTKTERMHFLNVYVKAMKEILDEGYNPHNYATYGNKTETVTAEKAIKDALEVKKKSVSRPTYQEYKQRGEEFMKFLKKEGRLRHDIKLISRKIVTDYLDMVLKRSSPRNRNHARNALSAIFTVLSDSFIIESNFIKNDIPKLRVKKKVDRRFNIGELQKLSKHLTKKDPVFLLFLKMVGYNFMRPIEVSRIKVGDIDLGNREVFFQQKTKKGKTKRIPDIYFDELAELVKGHDDGCSVFTPSRTPEVWDTNDRNKRDYWSKQFKKVKEATGIDTDMYGLRHFYISETYKELRKKYGKTETIDRLMAISGHDSRGGLENYIHVHDLEKPEDWSGLLTTKL